MAPSTLAQGCGLVVAIALVACESEPPVKGSTDNSVVVTQPAALAGAAEPMPLLKLLSNNLQAEPEAPIVTPRDGVVRCATTMCNDGSSTSCPAPAPCQHTEGFNLQTQACEYRRLQDGASCDDNNPCTADDRCYGGECQGIVGSCG